MRFSIPLLWSRAEGTAGSNQKSSNAADLPTRAQRSLSITPLSSDGVARLRRFRTARFRRHNRRAEPIAGELERIGGSRAQLDLVEFTLLKAYLAADRRHHARRMLSVRHPDPSGIPVAGLAAMH
jgi:hypothetical protein